MDKKKIKNPLSGVTRSVVEVEKKFVNNDEIKNGFMLLGRGIAILGRESGKSFWKVIKESGLAFHYSFTHYPYPWTFIFVGGLFIYSMLSIGKARIERDEYARHSFEMEKKLDSLKVITDFYANYNKTLSERVDSFAKSKSSHSIKRLNSSSEGGAIIEKVIPKKKEVVEIKKEDVDKASLEMKEVEAGIK